MARTITANVTLWARPLVVVANGKKLGAGQADLLRNAARAAVQSSADLQRNAETESAAVLCRRGKLQFVTASAAQIQQLRDAFEPVYSWLRQDAKTRSNLERIQGLRAQLPAAPTANVLTCPGAEPPAATAASKLDGVYQTSFTKAELAASPLLYDEAEINDENWGDLTLTIKEGQVTLSKRGAGTDTGTCTVQGDTVLLTFTGTGETFGFHWNLYRDTLTFRRDEALGPGPTPFLSSRGDASADLRTRNQCSQPGARTRLTVDQEGSAERLDPVGQTVKAGASGWIRATDSVVGHLDDDLTVRPDYLDPCVAGLRVLTDVGKSFRTHEVGSRLDGRG